MMVLPFGVIVKRATYPVISGANITRDNGMEWWRCGHDSPCERPKAQVEVGDELNEMGINESILG